ncbi:hypothetical protein JTE90_003535 [Oedothorax gibbosus]|uniref:Uncharacterized protein n=1 Tax=Oedothorax gibbosus TaxID=931172 RepID=A0AAV6UNF5_9ARAC|nr:hypothetical protein JTE90_003535 [Oedothorax gibbosus]
MYITEIARNFFELVTWNYRLQPAMSGAEEHIQSDSEVSHDEDSAVEESETSPIHPSGSNDPKSQGITNGNRTPPKKPAPTAFTPPRPGSPHSPLLRTILSSPVRVITRSLTNPLQASTSQATFIPGAASVNVPGIAETREASTSSASTASVIPGVGEISNTYVVNAPVTIPLPEDAGASVSAPEDVLRASTSLASNNPEAGEISNTEEGNAAVEILLPEVEAPRSVVVSEAEGGSIPEMIQTPVAVAAGSPAITQLEGEGIPEIKPAPAPRASTPPRAGTSLLRNLLSSPARVFLPAVSTDPLQASTSQAILEGNVPGAIPSVEAASSNVLASEVVQGNTPESVSIVESGSCVTDTGANVGKSPDLKTVSSKEVGVPADLPASETTKAGISEAVQNIGADVPETLQSTIAPRDPELVEEMKTSNPMVSAATAVESGQASELAVEASQTSEPTSEEYSQASATLEEAKTTSEPATISSGSGQTSKPAEEAREVSQPTEEAREVSKPPKSVPVVTVIGPSQVTEPHEEPMDTSEPSESGQASESKQEPGRIDTKEADRSPVKRPARGRLEDLKSDDPNTLKSPSRRSSRLQALQRTHSESPSPKKERRTVRSSTLERVPSDETLGVRTRSRRVGSTSSNSEMEGSGDEAKAKRLSRKDSKK